MSVIQFTTKSEESPKPESPITPVRPPFGSNGTFGTYGVTGEQAFPLDALPRTMRDIVTETARVTQTPEALAACIALGTIATAIGGGIVWRSNAHRETPANAFILAAVKSGTGKGQSMGIIAKPLYRWEDEANESWNRYERPRLATRKSVADEKLKTAKGKASTADKDSLEQVIDELTELESELAEITRALENPPRLATADGTAEALAGILANQRHEALASLTSEARGVAGVLLGRYGKNGATDEGLYLSGYSGDPVKVDRKGGTCISLSAPRLSVLWLVQPDKAREIAGHEGIAESGFLQRFLFAEVKADFQDEPENMDPPSPKILAAWNDLTHSLIENYHESAGDPVVIDGDHGAREVIRTFTNASKRRARDGQPLADVAPFVSRWGENAARLALVIHCAKHGSRAHTIHLEADTAQAAVAIVQWFSDRQLEFLAESRTAKAEKRLSQLLVHIVANNGELSRNTAYKSHGFDWLEVEALAAQFPSKIATEKRETAGRPVEVVRLARHETP